MSKQQRVFIIGHPGAGKALVAKYLADKLGWRYVDADMGLEFRLGRSLSEIMGAEGEAAFHRCQNDLLNSLVHKDNIVVTTDASIVCDEKNREFLTGENVVYLKVSTPVQIQRTLRNQAPLLLLKHVETLFDSMHEERDKWYQQVASITINSDDSALEQHVQHILDAIPGAQITTPAPIEKKDLVLFHKQSHTPVKLTEQQATCIGLLAQGKSAKEIAHAMDLSPRTVEDYIAKMVEYLGCSTSKELIALYHSHS